MRTDYVDITILLDESGSMLDVASDTIGGVNTLINEQKRQAGKATLSIVKFDDRYTYVYDAIDLQSVPTFSDRDYKPLGTTALLDAVHKAITTTGGRLASMAESERPGKVIFIIITDGFENSSKKHTLEEVRALITQQSETYKWEFVFVGAGVDAFAQGASLGISADYVANVGKTSAGLTTAYGTLGTKLSTSRATFNSTMAFDQTDYNSLDSTISDAHLKNAIKKAYDDGQDGKKP